MDSVLHGERERFYSPRRISQDISALHATLAARSERKKGNPHGLNGDQANTHVPEIIVEEGAKQAHIPDPSAGYDVFLAKLRHRLSRMKNGQGKSLYTTQQIQAQLDDSQLCPLDHGDRCFGETGGIMYFGRGELGMEHLHAEASVKSLTTNSSGYEEMDRKWASLTEASEASFRWIHLPANNIGWAQQAIAQILTHFMSPDDEDDPMSALISPSALEDQILRPELWEAQQNLGAIELPHARFMRPFCQKINASLTLPQSQVGKHLSRHDSIINPHALDNPVQAALGNSMVLFMPFIHWETTLSYLHMKNVIQDVDAGGIGVFGSPDIAGLPCGTDEKLLRHYLQRLQPMHVRRTLDQFGYYTIADTTSRDKDQVVDRYSQAHHSSDLIVPPMLMVDQCWLWLLGGNTILTCFPHRWNRSSQNDPTDVYESILELLDDHVHRSKVQNAGQLATVIIDRCAGNILDRTLIKDEHLRFLDFFDWSIDDLNERQSQCLQALWQDVQNSRHDDDTEGLTDISKEFDVLEKIKDIIDELQIVLRLIDQQQFAFNMVLHDKMTQQIPTPDHNSDGATTPVHQFSGLTSTSLTEFVDFQRLQENAREHAESIKVMIDRANATYTATLDVLSLKQQQANISEARSSRKAAQEMEKMAKEAKKSAEESEKQSYSIMLFTVVTIFFLPMSSIASIFGVNAVEFGQGQMHLSTMFAYLIPISVFVVYISFFLAFNHKARRSLLLCAQILRAYVNLALPVVFDEHKESKLVTKLRELKEKRHAQRDRKKAKMEAKRRRKINGGERDDELEKPESTETDDGTTQIEELLEAKQQEAEEGGGGDNVSHMRNIMPFPRDRSRFNSVASMRLFARPPPPNLRPSDAEAGIVGVGGGSRPLPPSRMSSYGRNPDGRAWTGGSLNVGAERPRLATLKP